MNAVEIQENIVKETKRLPVELQGEILDFVLYLKTKNTSKSNLDEISLSLLQKDEIIHLEKEFEDYKSLYPHE